MVQPGQTLATFSTQHFATKSGTTCCIRLATLLRCVETCWMMLSQIWKPSNFSCNILDVATFTQHCCTRACALGLLVARKWPGAQKHRHVALKMLRAFSQPVQHMSQHHATMYWTSWPNARNIFNILNARCRCLCARGPGVQQSGPSAHALVQECCVIVAKRVEHPATSKRLQEKVYRF